MESLTGVSKMSIVSARKPYTITKQRERWTDDEHNRFLEALKLYGRAWQRIEEHIGTKTAVQIRSHAQKFFSKLEKEALVKGVAVGQAIDIEIPPPRPKRKPNTPYPRKTGASSPNTHLPVIDEKQVPTGSSPTTNLDLEKQQLSERTAGSDGKPGAEENCGHETCSETLTLFKDTPSNVAAASTDENSATTAETASKSRYLKEPMPMKKQVVNNDRYVSPYPNGLNKNHKDDNPDTVMTAQNETGNEAKTFPRHAPVQILDGSIGASSQAPSSDVSFQESSFHNMGIPGHPTLYSYPPVSPALESQNSTSRSNHHQQSFHPPLTMLPNIQEYSPYMQISSTFSNLIISTLLQNPAAHAAASFAASYWPSATVDSSSNCPGSTNNGVFSHSIAAIAAATVAAATAWWAAHGLLPFGCPPGSATNPFASAVQTQPNGEERVDNNVQNTDQEIPKSSETSSSDSGNVPEAKKELVTGADSDNKDVVPAMTEQKDLSLIKTKKQVDRSSCGSNTPSGSDAEIDALQKNEGNEQPKEPDSCQLANETGNRRSRVAGCINDNWKAVSEGGRLAFQALFSRERLPQSFSPSHEDTAIDKQPKDGVDENMQNAVKNNEEDESKLDLNSNTWESCFNDHQVFEKIGSREEDNNAVDRLLSIGLKTRKTGFKPYKRCSVEVRESTMNSSCQEPEQRCKRLRVEREGEA